MTEGSILMPMIKASVEFEDWYAQVSKILVLSREEFAACVELVADELACLRLDAVRHIWCQVSAGTPWEQVTTREFWRMASTLSRLRKMGLPILNTATLSPEAIKSLREAFKKQKKGST